MRGGFGICLLLLSSVLMHAAVISVDNNTTQAIQDNQCFDKTFIITQNGTISDAQIVIDIDHTWRADLDISLISPGGTTVDLTSDNGGSNDNLKVHFLDETALSITNDSNNHTTIVQRRPEQALSAFYKEDYQGTWTLHICDDAGGDQGTFNGATLRIVDQPVDTDLAVNFRMDECYWLGGANGVTDDVKDSSANHLHAQSRNKADNTANNAVLCRVGHFLNTYADPNKSDAVFYPNETNIEKDIAQTPPFSISVWLYRENNDKWMAGIIKVSDESWSDGWGIEHSNGSGENIDFFVGSYNDYIRTSLPSQTWTHLVATYDGNSMLLYKNGTLVGSKTQTSYTPGNHPIFIGDDVSGSNYDDRWQGYIDEVKVWHRVLSPGEIAEMYANENSGNNFDGTPRVCPSCNGDTIPANTWRLIGIPADLRQGNFTVDDVFGDDMNGTYGTDWVLYERVYSTTDNGSSYRKLEHNDTVRFGIGYWLGSKLDNAWYVDGLPTVDYNSSDSACVNPPCVEIDLTPVTHDFETDGDDGTGAYRYNLSGFIGLQKPVNWSDCRFLIDGTAYTPSDANTSGYANKQIWFYDDANASASQAYTTCDDTMPCKLIPFKGFWIQLQGKTKGKTVKLLIPKESP